MILKEVIKKIQAEFNPQYSEENDNIGLLLGNYESIISNILVTIDLTIEVVDESIKKNCNLIITYHPILYDKINKINNNYQHYYTIEKCIKNDINVYCIHTCLDNHEYGLNYDLANKLNLRNLLLLNNKMTRYKKICLYNEDYNYLNNIYKKIYNKGIISTLKKDKISILSIYLESNDEFEYYLNSIIKNNKYEIINTINKNNNIGIGIIGETYYKSEKEFLNFIKSQLNIKNIRHSNFLNNDVKKICILAGSGAYAIDEAIKNQCDIFITSDLKYHDFHKANNKILLVDIGHYESEKYAKDLIINILIKKITNLALIKSKVKTNPIKYF